MRVSFIAGVLLTAAVVLAGTPPKAKTEAKAEKGPPAPPVAPKAGIKTPGVQIPIQSLTSEAEIAVETPGWPTIADSVFVPNSSKDQVTRIDPKTNKLLDAIGDLKTPCAGAVAAFGSLWIPNCGAQTLTRFDPKSDRTEL